MQASLKCLTRTGRLQFCRRRHHHQYPSCAVRFLRSSPLPQHQQQPCRRPPPTIRDSTGTCSAWSPRACLTRLPSMPSPSPTSGTTATTLVESWTAGQLRLNAITLTYVGDDLYRSSNSSYLVFTRVHSLCVCFIWDFEAFNLIYVVVRLTEFTIHSVCGFICCGDECIFYLGLVYIYVCALIWLLGVGDGHET